ncbi:MAG: hypothetical protein QHH07_11940 [Sedimentisphaerales bacterium]|nr:hypothetical protein [Sedimentisphaerales bacterium]
MTTRRSLVTALALLSASICMAGPTVTVFDSPYQAGQGGEFEALILAPGLDGLPTGTRFQTFCVEKNEYINLGSSYYARVLTYADLGGIAGGPYDPLDPRAAWLYDQFLNQTLPGYDFSTTSGRLSSAEALQHAIWYIEQEETDSQINALPAAIRTATWDFINLANASDWAQQGTTGQVRVLSLYSDPQFTSRAQDLLCRVVPAPGALLMTSLGTVLMGIIRRKSLGLGR